MNDQSNLTPGVAAAQIESIPNELDRNLRKHLDLIDAARTAGVDILVFPELSLSGHGSGAHAARLAVDRAHRHVLAIARASGPMLTMFGAIERADPPTAAATRAASTTAVSTTAASTKPGSPTFYNAAFAVRAGRVVHVHRKINLATYGRLNDGAWFAAGDRVAPFDFDDTGGWRIAPMICADTWNPPLVHVAATHGATLMLVAVSSALEAVGGNFDNPAGWEVNLRFHALTYGLPIVMANRVGREDGLTFWGGSRIVDARGRVVASAERVGEALIRTTVSLDEVRRARELLPTIRDANVTLLAHEFAALAAATRSPCRHAAESPAES